MGSSHVLRGLLVETYGADSDNSVFMVCFTLVEPLYGEDGLHLTVSEMAK